MIRFIFLCWLLIAFSGYGLAQTAGEVVVRKDYDGRSFTDFVRGVESDDANVTFYFFPGWVADLRIRQTENPATLEDVLDATLESTDYRYFINGQGQVILTLGASIQSEWQYVDPAESPSPGGAPAISVHTAVERQFEDFATDWAVIGDPAAPEQKPRVRLSGLVYSAEDERPLQGAIVYVEELKAGTTTDTTGFYEITVPQGRYQLVFQSVGLKETTRKVQMYASGEMDVRLPSLILSLEEIVVSADRKESVREVQMGREALKTEAIKELPTLLGEVDIVRSALMLPGVQSTGEFTSGINVRGGGADQNLILLNGAPVFNASHLFGFSSSFSPDVVEGFELYKSSIPAKYGGRISSVLDIQMKEGSREKWVFRGGVSPVTSRITAEGPVAGENSSLIVSGRATYSNWILKRLENAAFRNSRANYYDLSARYNTRFAQNNDRLDVSAYLSNDVFQLNGDTTFGYQNRNIAAHYQHEYSQRLYVTFSGIFSQYNFRVDSDRQPVNGFDLSYRINYTEGRAHFSYAPNDDHQVNFGLNISHYGLDPGQIEPSNAESIIRSQTLEREQALEGSLYLSDEWSISDDFSVYAGLRFTNYLFLGPKTVLEYRENAARVEANIVGMTEYGRGQVVQRYGGPEYRLSARYAFDANTSVKAAVNRNRQYLSMLFNSATVSPTATWKLADRHILPQTGDQFSLGIYRNLFDDRLECSVEGYYKVIQDMLEYKAGAELLLNEHLETDLVNGEGKAYGVEFLLKKHGRKLNGWISYTYSRTLFRADGPFPEDRINRGDWFPSNFDIPHDFSFAGYYKLSRRFRLSSSVVYSTGRPITVPVAKYRFADGVRLHYSQRNEFRMPYYFRWDLSVNIEGNHKIKKLAHSSWSVSLYNATGRRNPYSIYFVSDGREARGYQLSIFGRPFLTLTYNFRL